MHFMLQRLKRVLWFCCLVSALVRQFLYSGNKSIKCPRSKPFGLVATKSVITLLTCSPTLVPIRRELYTQTSQIPKRATLSPALRTTQNLRRLSLCASPPPVPPPSDSSSSSRLHPSVTRCAQMLPTAVPRPWARLYPPLVTKPIRSCSSGHGSWVVVVVVVLSPRSTSVRRARAS